MTSFSNHSHTYCLKTLWKWTLLLVFLSCVHFSCMRPMLFYSFEYTICFLFICSTRRHRLFFRSWLCHYSTHNNNIRVPVVTVNIIFLQWLQFEFVSSTLQCIYKFHHITGDFISRDSNIVGFCPIYPSCSMIVFLAFISFMIFDWWIIGHLFFICFLPRVEIISFLACYSYSLQVDHLKPSTFDSVLNP